MSKTNRTLSDLEANLYEDLAWRIKEIGILRKRTPSQKGAGAEQDVLIRAGITILYAHWEGFVKYAAECYLQFVSLQRLKYQELDYCFMALCSRKSINELIKTNQFKLQKEMIQNLLDNLENKAYVPYEDIINTKSNLSFEIFSDICSILGIDERKYQTDRIFINEQLLNNRNKIAHGKYRRIDYNGYIEIHDKVITLMRQVNDDILNAAVLEKYKRSPEN